MSLLYVLSWVPDTREAVVLGNTCNLSEEFLDAAIDAHRSDAADISSEISRLLMNWAFKAGKYDVAWHVLPNGLCDCATVALVRGGGPICDQLKTDIADRLASDHSISDDIRGRVAREIREKAQNLNNIHEFSLSRRDNAMNLVNRDALAALLNDIALLVRPEPLA